MTSESEGRGGPGCAVLMAKGGTDATAPLHRQETVGIVPGDLRGGAGVTQGTRLRALHGWHRALRLSHGPDEVHLPSFAEAELGRTPVLQSGRVVP